MKKLISLLLSVIILSMSFSFVSALDVKNPTATMKVQIPRAIEGNPYSYKLFDFNDEGYIHSVILNVRYYDNGWVEDSFELPYSFKGLTFNNDGTITGTANNEGELTFGARVEWKDNTNNVVKSEEYSFNNPFFILSVEKVSSAISLPNSAEDLAFDKKYLMSDTTEKWFRFTAVASDIVLEKSGKENEYVGVDIFDSNGFVCEGTGFGLGENEDGSWMSRRGYRTNPGDIYYVRVSDVSGASFTILEDISLDMVPKKNTKNNNKNINLISTNEYKKFDNESNLNWNVYKYTFRYDWNGNVDRFPYGCGYVYNEFLIRTSSPVHYEVSSNHTDEFYSSRDYVYSQDYVVVSDYIENSNKAQILSSDVDVPLGDYNYSCCYSIVDSNEYLNKAKSELEILIYVKSDSKLESKNGILTVEEIKGESVEETDEEPQQASWIERILSALNKVKSFIINLFQMTISVFS